MTAPITKLAAQLDLTYNETETLMRFIRDVRGPDNTFSGKYSVKLNTINSLFNASWETIPTKSGHKKLKHSITQVVIEYSNHDSPLDPGAAENIAKQVQSHINLFFYSYLNCAPRKRPGTRDYPGPHNFNFTTIAQNILNAPANPA